MRTAQRKRPIPKEDHIEAVQQSWESKLSPSGFFRKPVKSATWTDAGLRRRCRHVDDAAAGVRKQPGPPNHNSQNGTEPRRHGRWNDAVKVGWSRFHVLQKSTFGFTQSKLSETEQAGLETDVQKPETDTRIAYNHYYNNIKLNAADSLEDCIHYLIGTRFELEILFLCLCLTFFFKHALIDEFCTHLINNKSDLEFVVVYNPRLVLN